MVSSKAETVEQYLDELPDDRRDQIAEVRAGEVIASTDVEDFIGVVEAARA